MLQLKSYYKLLLLSALAFTAFGAGGSSDLSADEIASLNSTCKIDIDCKNFPEQICSDEFKCVHKRVFPILPMEFGGIYVVGAVIALSCMAGIGGGGVVVPLCMVFFNFGTKNAVAISGFCILLCSIIRFIYNRKQQHPEKEAVCLDYGVATVMLPTVLVGSLIGVHLNSIFPDIYIQILLTLIEGSLSIQTGFRARTLFKKESQQNKALQKDPKGEESIKNYQETPRQQQEQENNGVIQNIPAIIIDNEGSESSPDSQGELPFEKNQLPLGSIDKQKQDEENQNTACKKNEEDNLGIQKASPEANVTDSIPLGSSLEKLTVREEATLKKLLKSEKGHLGQWKKHLLCIIVLIGLMLVTLFRVSKRTESIVGLEKCGAGDWCILGAFVVIALGVTWVAVRRIKAEQDLKKRGNIKLASSDLEFDKPMVSKIIVVGLVGGITSGAFGLGGGTIFNPVLLYFGLPPKVVSSTSMYMIMYSTFSSSFIYLIFGTLNIQYACWIAFWCVLGTMIGLKVLDTVMKKFQRQSPIVILLACLMAMAAIMVPIFGGLDLKEQKDAGIDILAFKSLC